jgi:hypothetical protein
MAKRNKSSKPKRFKRPRLASAKMNVFIKIDNPIDFRRNTLEVGRNCVLAQKSSQEIESLRKQKRARLNDLKRTVGKINKLNIQLDKIFPLKNLKDMGIKIEKTQIVKKISSIKEEPIQQTTPKKDKLDSQLAELEARLRGM